MAFEWKEPEEVYLESRKVARIVIPIATLFLCSQEFFLLSEYGRTRDIGDLFLALLSGIGALSLIAFAELNLLKSRSQVLRLDANGVRIGGGKTARWARFHPPEIGAGPTEQLRVLKLRCRGLGNDVSLAYDPLVIDSDELLRFVQAAVERSRREPASVATR